jgi:hypothetical protein
MDPYDVRPDVRPYTYEELAAMRKTLDGEIQEIVGEFPGARPLPPLSEDEAHRLLFGLLSVAMDRRLTRAEGFLGGQLIAAYQMGIRAAMLGRPNERYFVFSQDDIEMLRPKPRDLKREPAHDRSEPEPREQAQDDQRKEG